ncbi:MAG: hypothetical protein U1F27_07095 [Turneriella sp.]
MKKGLRKNLNFNEKGHATCWAECSSDTIQPLNGDTALILAVDDTPTNLVILEKALRAPKYQTLKATGGQKLDVLECQSLIRAFGHGDAQ